MLEHLDKCLVGYYQSDLVATPKNLNNRDNQQERLELVKFK